MHYTVYNELNDWLSIGLFPRGLYKYYRPGDLEKVRSQKTLKQAYGIITMYKYLYIYIYIQKMNRYSGVL